MHYKERWTAPQVLAFLCLLPGCYYLGQNTYENIKDTPSSTWSGPEQYTIIMEAGNHNLRDYRTNIKAIVTPYYPSVIKSIGRRAQAQYHWQEQEFRSYVDRLLYESSAMFIDWENPDEPVYDSKVHHLDSVTQFDSLMILLTLRNNGYPGGKYILIQGKGNGQRIPIDDVHYEPPDITHLDSMITLVNEQGGELAPMSVWGRRMNYLTNVDETLFVKFNLKEGNHHFLERANRYFVRIRGLEGVINLELSTNLMN
jgi:hypothetical protein